MAIDKRRAILRLAGPDITQNIYEVNADQPVKVGRLSSCDIPLKHTKVSREHAIFEFSVKGLTIKDLKSANGTFIGGNRVDPDVPILLNTGDTIRIGPFTILFEQTVEAGQERIDMEIPASMHEAVPEGEIGSIESLEMPAPTPPGIKPPTPPGIAAPVQEREGISPLGWPQEAAPGIPIVPIAPGAVAVPGGVPPILPPRPGGLVYVDGNGEHMVGIPRKASSLLQYLPAVFSDDPFTGRFLLIFEAIHAPLEWIVDCFYCYLDTRLTPPEWLQWFGSWVDIVVPASLPESKQRAIAAELGPLFVARGTKVALTRHLELVFDVKPEIDEPKNRPNTFIVTLSLGKAQNTENNREIARRIIESHRPIHAQYELKIN